MTKEPGIYVVGKDILFNKQTVQCWENWKTTCKRMKFDQSYTLQKTNTNWIKDLNVRPETTKRPQENIGSELLDISVRDKYIFLDLTAKEKATNAKISKWYNIKLKSVCTAKETTK